MPEPITPITEGPDMTEDEKQFIREQLEKYPVPTPTVTPEVQQKYNMLQQLKMALASIVKKYSKKGRDLLNLDDIDAYKEKAWPESARGKPTPTVTPKIVKK